MLQPARPENHRLRRFFRLSPRPVRHWHISGRINADALIGGNYRSFKRTGGIYVRPLMCQCLTGRGDSPRTFDRVLRTQPTTSTAFFRLFHFPNLLFSTCYARCLRRVERKTSLGFSPTSQRDSCCTAANEFQDDIIDNGLRKGREVVERSKVPAPKTVMTWRRC
jgi:hypothetical protein